MEYKVTLYKNSGYNVINIPDTPQRLTQDSETETLPSINILQNRRLTSVTVACTNASAEQADYIKIGNMFYAITNFSMQSVSTCTFQIVEKPLLSVGGIKKTSDGLEAAFDILDGVTSRCTVSDDSWGKYTSEDPLTAPQEPLQLQTEWLIPSGGKVPETVEDDPIMVETTVDLVNTLTNEEGTVYKDDSTGENVIVPEVIPSTEDSSFIIDKIKKSNGTRIYIRNDTYQDKEAGTVTNTAQNSITNGLSTIRSLGIEQGSIISQWRIPKQFFGDYDIKYFGAPYGEQNSEGTLYEKQDQIVHSISGVSGEKSSTISPDYASVHNKRLLYGSYNKYGMITCAGNSVEFKPEELGGETAPSVTCKSDPRPKGKPYYRFTTINGDTEFWRNCLAGSEWENVPLVYQGSSGSALNRMNYNNQRKMEDITKENVETRSLVGLVNPFGRVAAGFAETLAGVGLTAGTAGGGAEVGVPLTMAGVSNLLQGGSGLFNLAQGSDVYHKQYDQQKANELAQLYQSTDVYAPTVNFPYNCDILRDVKDNGVLIYKYRMSDNDVKRIDKLLTMYGYKETEELTLDHFQRRQKFDFVACSSVSVTGKYPQWLLDDIADELKNGVRIWHVKPNADAYENNPIR